MLWKAGEKSIVIEKIPWPLSRLYDRFPNRIFASWFKVIADEIESRGISGNILDIGTGPGRLPIEIARRIKDARLFGLDLSDDMIAIARGNAAREGVGGRVEFKVANACATGFESNFLDLIVSTETLHHIPKPVDAFNEIYRVLKPGGQAWIFDGRSDATMEEYDQTARMLGIDALPLPMRLVKRFWAHGHTGLKTAEYFSGKIARAISESLFTKADIRTEGAFIRIELKKP